MMNARLTLAIGGAALAPGAQVSPLSCIQAPHEFSQFYAFQVSKLHKPAHLRHPSITLSLLNLSFFFLLIYFKKIYLLLFFAAPRGILGPSSSPPQGRNPHPLCWKRGVLTTGPPGKSFKPPFFFLIS